MAKGWSACVVEIDELVIPRPCSPTSALSIEGFLAPVAKLRVEIRANISRDYVCQCTRCDSGLRIPEVEYPVGAVKRLCIIF